MGLTTFNRGLLLMMTIERWIVICRPLSSMQKFQDRRRFFITLLLLAILSVLINLPRSWEYSAKPRCRQSLAPNATNATDAIYVPTGASTASGAPFIANEETDKVVYRVVSHPEYMCNTHYLYGYNFIVTLGMILILPMLIMVVLNGMAIFTLIKGRDTLKVRSVHFRTKYLPLQFCFIFSLL